MAELALMTAADIESVDDFCWEDLVIPEWKKDGKPQTVRIRVMTSEDRHNFEGAINRSKEEGKWTADLFDARIAFLCLCDARGERLFKEEKKVREVLAKRSGNALARIVKAAMKLNLLTEEAVEAEKNASLPAPKSAFGSNSATDSTSPISRNSDGKLAPATSGV